MGSGPLDHPRLLEIEERLDRAEIDAAQRLLAQLGDLQVHRTAITYFATRLLYQRGRLDSAGVVERLRELMLAEPVFPQASAMLSAAERGTLRPDREGFQRATMSPLETPMVSAPSSPPAAWSEPVRKESSAPTIELGLDDLDTDHDQLSHEIADEIELIPSIEPARARTEPRRSLSMPQIPRAPMVPRFTPPANLAPSYAPGARSASAQFELELELPDARDTIRQSEPDPGNDPSSSGRMRVSSPYSTTTAESVESVRSHGPESMLARARLLWAQGGRDQALAHVERLEHAPLLDPELRAECARFLIEACEPERALLQARLAIHDDPGSALVQLMLVWSLVRSARRAPNHQAIDEAERVLSRLRAKPGPIPALMQALRASVLAEKGDPDRAITTARLALKLDAEALDAEAALSLACARLGRLDDAQSAWQRLRVLSPDEAEHLCDRLQQLGVALREVEPVPSRGGSSAVRLWDKIEVDLFSGEQASAVAAFERGAARELRGLVGENATDAIPLLATMAAGFFTTEPVWRHFAPFDLSLGSIARVEAVLDVMYGRKQRAVLSNEAYPAQVMLSTYVGECLRQGYGGAWVGSLAVPETVFVDTEHCRFAPFHELRLRLEQGKRLLFAGAGSRRVRASGAPITMPMAPPTPWDPAEWPSPRMLPRLGLAFAQSVVELYCAEFGGGPLDRSLAGLQALDNYVNLLAPTGAKIPTGASWAKRAAVLVGAYLGETLREVLGAAWRDTLGAATGPESYALLLPDGGSTHPVEQAYERLSGKSTTSLHEYATRLAEDLG
jgi:tetratricopeptide (TPR) repeat protein